MSETAHPAAGATDTTGDEVQITVGWPALWAAFGFDSADAAGNTFASDTQLDGALQCTEQSLAGDAREYIEAAVGDGILTMIRQVSGKDCAYALVGGER